MSGHFPSVLMIDDDPDTLEALSIALSTDFKCTTFSSRDEALKHIQSGYRPACIVTDFSMPGMSLDEFWKALLPARFPFVIATAHSNAAEAAKQLGIKRLLMKPLQPDELIAAINMAIGSGEHFAIK